MSLQAKTRQSIVDLMLISVSMQAVGILSATPRFSRLFLNGIATASQASFAAKKLSCYIIQGSV